MDALEILPVADKRADLGLRFPREQIAADARRPEHPLQLERVVADRVAVGDDRMELMREAQPFDAGGHSPRTRPGRPPPLSGAESPKRRPPAAPSCARSAGAAF